MKPIRAASRSDTLHSGEAPGTPDAMEERIAKLEQIAEEAKLTLNSIFVQLSRIDAKLASKPDEGRVIILVCIIVGLVLGMAAFITGVFVLIR